MHNHSHSPLAAAMHAALKVCKVNDKFPRLFISIFWSLLGQEFCTGISGAKRHILEVRVLVMVSSCLPSSAQMNRILRPFETEGKKKNMLLVMRVLSIVPLQFKV